MPIEGGIDKLAKRAPKRRYTDPRADALRERYHAIFGGEDLPVPVESIAEDLLGLTIEEHDDLPVSGMLVPAERRIVVNGREARESPGRRRFTLAHELGHWVCQCLNGATTPVYCRSADLDPAVDRSAEREANIFAAELLMPEAQVKAAATSGASLPERFRVSAEALQWRLHSFGLGPPPRSVDGAPV